MSGRAPSRAFSKTGLRLELGGAFPADAVAPADLDLPAAAFVMPSPGRRLGRPPRRKNTLRGVGPGPVPTTRPGERAGPLPAKAPTERRRKEETLPRGAIIDKYRIEGLLGRGGFAVVYRATHLLLNTQVAIKLLRPQLMARHPHLARLLCDEARFAARIDHPNVVRVHDVTHTPNITYVVMEFIDGRSLAETIERGALAPVRVLEIAAGIVTGLKVALAAGLIHRDIKPANVLLGRNGEIKIVDLGLGRCTNSLAQDREGDRADGEPPSGRRATIGTYGYMAPEQAVDPEQVDFRADMYSLGATLYEAATGGPPFPLGDPGRCQQLHALAAVPPPERRVPGFPRPLSELLLRLLAKKPDDRFASYDALAEALGRVSAALTGSQHDLPLGSDHSRR